MGSDGAIEAALVDWINSFPVDTPITTITELSDGTVICKILLDIDPNKFEVDLSKISVSTQWIVRFQNLKKIYRALGQYHTSTLGLRLPTSLAYQPNLSSIARDGSRQELVKLVKIVIVTAIQSDRKEDYILLIRELSPSSQTELMLLINEMMNLEEHDTAEDDTFDATISHTTEIDFRMEEEIAKLIVEKDTAEAELVRSKERQSRLQKSNEELRVQLLAAQDKAAKPSKGDSAHVRTDAAIKSYLEQLQTDVHKLEDIVSEKENSIASQENVIKSMTRKVDELTKTADLAEKLKDELDTAIHTIDKLKKEQNVMQHYRRKLESMPELEKKLKYFEEENASLQKEAVRTEDTLRQAVADKKLLVAYKKQVDDFQIDHAELLKEQQRLEIDHAALQDKLASMESQRTKDLDLIQTYENRIRELEHGTIGQLSPSGDRDLESEITFNNVTKSDLKLQVNKLQREVQSLKGEGDMSGDNFVLKSLLEDKERSYKRLEQDYVRENGDKLALEAALAVAKSGTEDSEFVQTLQKNLRDRDEIIEQSRIQQEKAVSEFERRYEKLSSQADSGSNADSVRYLYDKCDELQLARAQIEEELEDQRALFGKMMLEKDDLQKKNAEIKDTLLDAEKLNGELKSSIAAFGGSTMGRESELEKRVLQLQDKLEDRREKMIKTREHIKKQSSTIRDFEEQLKVAKSAITDETLLAAEERVEEQKLAHKHQMETLIRENSMMTSAWFDITSRLQTNTVSLGRRREEPSSWLGKQRSALTKSMV